MSVKQQGSALLTTLLLIAFAVVLVTALAGGTQISIKQTVVQRMTIKANFLYRGTLLWAKSFSHQPHELSKARSSFSQTVDGFLITATVARQSPQQPYLLTTEISKAGLHWRRQTTLS